MSKFTEWVSNLPKWAKITIGSIAGTALIGGAIAGAVAIGDAVKKNEQLKCEHEYGEFVVTKKAVCDVDGVKSRTCAKCDKVDTEAIPMLGHKTKVVEGYAATCTTDGKTDGTVCEVCEKSVTEQKAIPMLGHNIVVDSGKTATCLEAGLTEGQHCKRCNEVLIKQETIPATGHNIITVYGYAATCEEAGITDGTKCANCETVYSEQVIIQALGHKPVTHAGKAATCLEKGWNSYVTCDRATCGYTTYEEIAALGHNFSNAICLRCSYQLPEGHECVYTMEEVTQATCETDGVKTKKCICGETTTEVIKAYGHAWNAGVVTKEPGCGVEGVRTFTCSNCNQTTTEAIAAIEHEFTETQVQELTCTTDGIVRFDCVNCGYYYTNTTESNGHNYDDGLVVLEPTCTQEGGKIYTCMSCGETISRKIAKLAHTVKSTSYVAPTCTTTGKTAGSYCSVCNTVLTAQKDIPALGHSFGAWQTVTELTCTTNGVDKRTCTVCGKTVTSTVEALGHSFENGVCTKCGAYPEELVVSGDITASSDGYHLTAGETYTITVNLQAENGELVDVSNDVSISVNGIGSMILSSKEVSNSTGNVTWYDNMNKEVTLQSLKDSFIEVSYANGELTVNAKQYIESYYESMERLDAGRTKAYTNAFREMVTDCYFTVTLTDGVSGFSTSIVLRLSMSA